MVYDPHTPILDDEPILTESSRVEVEMHHTSDEDNENIEDGLLSSESEENDSD